MIPILSRLIRKIAPRIGAKVIIEPEWKIVGQIQFKNGRKRYFRYSSIDLNPLAAADVAKDKDYASFFLRKMGYQIIPGQAFYSAAWCATLASQRNAEAACVYAQQLGFPVIVKPNSGSQGAGVAKVFNARELAKALRVIFRSDRIALVQPVVTGHDYRIVVLDNAVISAYERVPLNVIGDGRTNIAELLTRKQKTFVASSRDTILKLDDPRILQKLKRQKLSLTSVPPKKAQVFLLDNANLSTGGDAVDVTTELHPSFRELAIHITRDMGLRLCGVDLLVAGDIRQPLGKYHIIEINAAPGLDHYAQSGKKQAKIVEDMYTQVLLAMERAA